MLFSLSWIGPLIILKERGFLKRGISSETNWRQNCSEFMTSFSALNAIYVDSYRRNNENPFYSSFSSTRER